MKLQDAEEICEELYSLIDLGPGDNKSQLRRVDSLLSQITRDDRANAYVREKVLSVRESFAIWFSPRRWNKAGDGGATARQNILTDIAKLNQACHTAF